MRAAICLVGALALTPAGAADFNYFERLKGAEKNMGSLDVFRRLDSMTQEERLDLLSETGSKLQWLATVRAFAGDADGAMRAMSWFYALRRPAEVDDASRAALETAHAEEAIEAIVRQAQGRRLVILNEAHHVPLNRVFAARLAHALRKIGFSYMACETFDEHVVQPLKNGRVSAKVGFYSNEPMYAEVLRSAVRDNWTFVSYDHLLDDSQASSPDALRLREEGGAQNIVERIFLKDPTARVFVYAGYGHIKESPTRAPEGGTLPLAVLLAQRLQTDPLTIDQVTMLGGAFERAEHPLYRAALARFNRPAPFVLGSGKGTYEVFGQYRGKADMQVFHPDERALSASGRPLWMETQAHLRPRPVPSDLLPVRGRRLVKAYHARDDSGSVPADIVVVEAGKPAPSLMLPAGAFRFEYED